MTGARSTRSDSYRRHIGPNPDFAISRKQIGPAVVLTVVGELELKRAPSFGVDVSDVLRERPQLVVIDLCHSRFVDSAGLSVLLNARRRSVRLGIELRIACDVPTTLRTLAVTRLDRDLDVYPTLEAALAGGSPAEQV